MKVYADASLIVSAFTDEPTSVASRAWLATLSQDVLLASKWCETEVASALALKVRTGSLPPEARLPVLRMVRDMLTASATIVAIDATHFNRATDLLERSDKGLRAGDALHLAIAADAGAKLFTLDRRMAEAGLALGLDVQLLT